MKNISHPQAGGHLAYQNNVGTVITPNNARSQQVYSGHQQATYQHRQADAEALLHGKGFSHYGYKLKALFLGKNKVDAKDATQYIQNFLNPPSTAVRHTLLHPKVIITLCVVGLFTVASLGVLTHKPKQPIVVANQTQIAGVTVANLSEEEALNKLNTLAVSQLIAITIDGKAYSFTASELGVKRDVTPTTDATYVKTQSRLEQMFVKQNRAADIKTYVNQKKLITAVESKLGSYKIAENASVSVNGETIAVNPSKPGVSIDFGKISDKLKVTVIGENPVIQAELTKKEPAITTAVATNAKAQADELIAKNYAVTTQNNEVKNISNAQKASWVRFTPDEKAKTLAVTIDVGAAKNTVSQLAKSYARGGKEKTTLSINGAAASVIDGGQDGISVDQKSIDDGLAGFEKALNEKQNYTMPITVGIQPAGERNLGSVNGGKFILVDVPGFKSYAIENTTTVRTMLVSTGTARMPTPAGNFKVLAKWPIKNMIGCSPAAGCWNVPNVPDVLRFTPEGHAFHGTYWHNMFGRANLSHGCVNLTKTDARWLYDWAQVGTDVIVIR